MDENTYGAKPLETASEKPIEIPWENLSPEALRGVIDDFIMREGTDYGLVEASHETKVKQIQKQLEKKRILLMFDASTESITLVVNKNMH